MRLIDELRRNGFIEGRNLTIEYRAWAPHVDLISNYAADLAARLAAGLATMAGTSVQSGDLAARGLVAIDS
jgi:hypothetical protein